MATPNDPAPTETQEVFGPYVVHERLGIGGMAVVHRARERGIEGFERTVALKRLLPHLAEDASFVKAFVREAKLASMLQHANIVQLFELGRVGTQYFISMEYIDGRDIRQVLRQSRRTSGPPTINVTVALLIQLCDALEYAHTKLDDQGEPLGLVHRDVSPSNLLVTRSGHLKVIDFGIAKAQSSHLRTQTGRVKGKLAYMAPEAVAGKDLDARSDIFSVGVIAHELLTARPLFASKNEYQTIVNVQKAEILPPSAFNQAVPPELDHVVLRALARDRDQRYESAAQMRDDLHAIRIRYQLSATNREVQTWIEWAFSLDSESAGFSGTTEAFGTVASRSPVASVAQVAALPLPLPAAPRVETPRSPVMASLAAAALGAQPTRHEEDDAADHAWGGKEPEDGVPVVLEEVPDHSHRMPAVAAAAGLEAAALDDAPTPRPPPVVAGARAATAPDAWPQGSSSDALPRQVRASDRFQSVVTANPLAVTATPAVEPLPAASTAAVPAPLSGLDAIAARSRRNVGGWVVGALALVGVAAAAVYVVPRMTAGRTSTAPPVTPATLKFIVEPHDATIKIAGMDAHVGAPWSIQLEPGVAQVKISRDGHLSWETSIELSASETQTVRVVLGPAPAGMDASQAKLELSSEPTGLVVLLDGHDVGRRTPLTMPLPPGTHTVSLRQAGEIVWRHTFDAEAGTLYQFNPSMSSAKRAERARREREPERSAPALVPERPRGATPAELLAARPAIPPGAGTAYLRQVAGQTTTTPPPGTAPGTAAVAPVRPGTTAGTTAGTGAGTAGTVGTVAARPGTTAGTASAVATRPGTSAATGGTPPTTPAVTQPATGTATTPATAPRATTIPVVPPNAVKRVSGSLPQISTINRTGAELPRSITAKICIDRDGAVTSVQIYKLTGEVADKIAASIRTWRYSPHSVAGRPSGACFVNAFQLGQK